MKTEDILATATQKEAKALKAWYGPDWASLVLSDEIEAAEEGFPHPLNDVTYEEFAEAKSAASSAWYNLCERFYKSKSAA